MLVGRERERQRIEGLLAGARRGAGGALLIRGDPGSGKSTLLSYAAERAEGMRVLAARGLEREAELPYAGLSSLLAPVLRHMSGLAAPQRCALEGALALGPASPDRFAVYAATLSLLTAAAEEGQPLAVVVDDAHWLDASSLEALGFTARRLGPDPVAMLFAARQGEQGALEVPGVAELAVGGLEWEAAASLLAFSSDVEIAPGVAQRLIDGTGGNPLALVELPRLLSEGQLAGTEPLVEPLPLGPGLEHSYRRRIEALGAEARRALVVAAASGGGMAGVAAALAALGLGAETLEAAEAQGLVAMGVGRVEFRHPLLRSAAYHGAPARQRRAAHRVLATAFSGEREAARRAWHLAAAALGPDEGVAGELELAAAQARGRGAPEEAGRALEAAARLTPDPERRVRRLMQAGGSLHLAGRPSEAMRLLERSLSEAEDPHRRAEIQHLRGQIEMFSGSASAARELLLREATAIEAHEPAKAVLMLADATGTLIMEARVHAACETAEHAHRLAQPLGGIPARVSELVLAQALTLRGETRRARDLIRRAESLLRSGEVAENAFIGTTCAYMLCWLEQEVAARSLVRAVVERARSASAFAVLPYALAVLCAAEFRLGEWTVAYAAGLESLQLSQETGQHSELAVALVFFGRLEAAQGRENDCRAHLEAALHSVERTGAESIVHLASSALGLLELGLGRIDEAIRRLEIVQRLERDEGLRQPTVGQSAPDLVEAYIRAGQLSHVETTLEELECHAEHTQGRWAAAVAARCRGLLAEEQEFEHHFRRALSLHEDVAQPFDRARTQLCFGERLRRARRRSDAREQLRPALATFEGLGAAPWVDQARRELSATGERLQRRETLGGGELTPAELQVALAVAEGATNQEVAAALFVSRRTVEAHLNRIYRKLAIRSRSELTRLVSEGGLPSRTTTPSS